MNGDEIKPVKVPVYLVREQLQELKRLSSARGMGITAYIQSVLSEHLFYNAPDYADHVIDAYEAHKAISEIAAVNDSALARHLKRPVVDLLVADRAEIDRELQYELNFQQVV